MRKEIGFLRPIFLTGLLFLGLAAAAQGDSIRADSKAVSPDKQLAKLLAQVSEDSTKLVKFNGMVSQFEKEKKDAANQAQESADDNKRAADRLADNPQDKKLARKARSAAKQAKSDSQKARVAADKLDDLNKDIQKLSRQLGKEQAKLDKYQAARAPAISAQ
jgi:chromosome segregation ATPase